MARRCLGIVVSPMGTRQEPWPARDRRGAMRRLPAALLPVAVLLTACASEIAPPSVEPSPSPSKASTMAPPTPGPFPLMSVELVGGECPAGSCDRLINVDADGRLHEVIPKDRTVGHVPPELIDALEVEMDRANFRQIRSNPFTGECPTAVDGQEIIYTFHLPTGDEEIRSCTVAIDPNHPLFQAVAAVLAVAEP
jgi:hypothetical protein